MSIDFLCLHGTLWLIGAISHRDKTVIKHELLGLDELPKPGTVVAIDAEFVSMQQVCHITGLDLST